MSKEEIDQYKMLQEQTKGNIPEELKNKKINV